MPLSETLSRPQPVVGQSGQLAEFRYGIIGPREVSCRMSWITLGYPDCSGKLNLSVEEHGEVGLGSSAPCLVTAGRNALESHTTPPF